MKIFSVLGYLFCFGISDCLWVYPNKKLPVIVSMTVRSLITASLFFALFMLTGHLNINWSNKAYDVLTAILISGVSYGGLYCYVNSLKYEQASVIAPVTTILTSLLCLVFTILFYHEVLTLKIGCCLVAAFLGVTLSFSHHYKAGNRIKFNKGTILSLGAAILWAISYTFFKTPIDRLGVITFSLILEATILMINVVFFLIGGFADRLGSLKFDKSTITLVIIGFLIFCGTLLNSYSYKLFPLIYLNVLGKIGVIIPILYCTIFLKEKLSHMQICGIGLLVASAVTIIL
jgi:drug/metabolite transporter (DMT)-like permease